ncbi:hypothetical protein [Bdellovibrio sp.]|uniref:hypothetical protein n=1 Tax=Bdellovibrio sp. TaxID=28201 RepID=UPI0039E324F4
MQSSLTPSKYIEQIDVRTFDHDIQVMKSRLALEDSEKVYSEYFQFKGSRDSAPDGVNKSLNGKIIAFEYEIAQKSKQRYRDKVRRYVDCIRRREPTDGPKYDHVRIVCEKTSSTKSSKTPQPSIATTSPLKWPETFLQASRRKCKQRHCPRQ